MYPAALRENTHPKPVIARTTMAAIRQPRYVPPGRHARANTSSGETTARKRKI
jgi:hypothetical protein